MLKPIFVESWQQLASAFTQELLPYLEVLRTYNLSVVEPFYNPTKSSSIQPFKTPVPSRAVGSFLEISGTVFNKNYDISRVRSVCVLKMNPHCNERVAWVPASEIQHHEICCISFEHMVNTIHTSTVDAFVVKMQPHYRTGWTMTKFQRVSYLPSFIKHTRNIAEKRWGVVPKSCLHIRFEQLIKLHNILIRRCISNVLVR